MTAKTAQYIKIVSTDASNLENQISLNKFSLSNGSTYISHGGATVSGLAESGFSGASILQTANEYAYVSKLGFNPELTISYLTPVTFDSVNFSMKNPTIPVSNTMKSFKILISSDNVNFTEIGSVSNYYQSMSNGVQFFNVDTLSSFGSQEANFLAEKSALLSQVTSLSSEKQTIQDALNILGNEKTQLLAEKSQLISEKDFLNSSLVAANENFASAVNASVSQIKAQINTLNVTNSGNVKLVSIADNYDADSSIVSVTANNLSNAITSLNQNGVKITALGGDDVITTAVSFVGNDKVDAGDGNDIVNVDSGINTVLGGLGNDSINALVGNDSIDGGAGNDLINAGAGDNKIVGGIGDDTINALVGNDSIDAGDGNDVVNSGDGDNKVITGKANDNVTTGSGNDKVDLGDGNDVVNSGAGNDSIIGGSGDDVISAGAGFDSIDAGAGNDEIETSGAGSKVLAGVGDDVITIYSASGSMPAGVLGYSLDGGAGNDTIYLSGSLGSHKVVAGSGNDILTHDFKGTATLDGGDGNDYIFTEQFNDVLTGGAGNDTFDIFWTDGAVKITDFKSTVDKIFIDLFEVGDTSEAIAVSSVQFQSGKGLVSATTVDARFVYNSTNGALFYDEDGSNVAFQPVQIALIANKPVLIASDILI